MLLDLAFMFLISSIHHHHSPVHHPALLRRHADGSDPGLLVDLSHAVFHSRLKTRFISVFPNFWVHDLLQVYTVSTCLSWLSCSRIRTAHIKSVTWTIMGLYTAALVIWSQSLLSNKYLKYTSGACLFCVYMCHRFSSLPFWLNFFWPVSVLTCRHFDHKPLYNMEVLCVHVCRTSSNGFTGWPFSYAAWETRLHRRGLWAHWLQARGLHSTHTAFFKAWLQLVYMMIMRFCVSVNARQWVFAQWASVLMRHVMNFNF